MVLLPYTENPLNRSVLWQEHSRFHPMLKSMTGYGKSSFSYNGVFYLLEIHSVNRKHLDVNLLIPREMLSLDATLRKWLTKALTRGQITLRLFKEIPDSLQAASYFNKEEAKNLKHALVDLAKSAGFTEKEVTLSLLLEQLEKLPKSKTEDLEKFETHLAVAFEQAIAALMEMKKKEGAELKNELFSYLDEIKKLIPLIQGEFKNALHEYENRLLQKLDEYKIAEVESREKLLKEVVFYADKGDISEEITRIYAHIKQVEETLVSNESAKGKMLDFLVQEMNREVHTMMAKSLSLHITQMGLQMKSYMEKIREQVQNID